MKLFTVAEMVAAERAGDARGHSYATMMERAGHGLARAVAARHAVAGRRVLVLVGPGNNGGDGLVAGRYLADAGADVAFYLYKPRDPAQDDNLAQVLALGLPVLHAGDDQRSRVLRTRLRAVDIVIDALLGTGVARPIGGGLAALLRQVRAGLEERQLAAADSAESPPLALAAPAPPPPARAVTVVACDCPSGLNCDSGALDPLALSADLTVTFAGPKQGHFLFPGAAAVGELVVADIGLGDGDAPHVRTEVATPAAMRRLLPPRPRDGHKGTFGTALVAAGSADYWGAPLLAGLGAYRAGCGLVALAVPAAVRPVVAGQLPEATFPALPDGATLGAEAADFLRPTLDRADALLVGPGLGRADAFLDRLLAAGPLPPLVVDADGLNYLARRADWWRALPANAVLTPHPGEMARLLGSSNGHDNPSDPGDQADRIQTARAAAARWGHVVVLKGAYTVVAAPDGWATLIPVADPALAVAGSGDVLAGVIVSLLAQGAAPYPAAQLGAWLHARAGSLAGAARGGSGMLAREIADRLPAARAEVAG